jgi:nucleoside-diphosphate-sugar epimerase
MHMRVLVSGSSGLIGSAVVEHLLTQGDQVVRFDVAEGHDVLDAEDYAAAARGCDAIVHAAGGQRPDASDSGQRFITHNVTGNWNMLEAAHNAGIGRVVTFSSVNAIGVFRGEAAPDYLPIDDDHPIRPPTAYGMAKRLIEELCRCYTVATGVATVCFRPPAARLVVPGSQPRALPILRRSGRHTGSTGRGSTRATWQTPCTQPCTVPN